MFANVTFANTWLLEIGDGLSLSREPDP
jgi:hypothetical protein